MKLDGGLLPPLGLVLVGSLLLVYGVNAGFEAATREGLLAYVYYAVGFFGLLLALAGGRAFGRRLHSD
ncbi:MAG: hypothetical protein ACLFMT_07210 [Halobacteriales archaeon]